MRYYVYNAVTVNTADALNRQDADTLIRQGVIAFLCQEVNAGNFTHPTTPEMWAADFAMMGDKNLWTIGTINQIN